MKVSVMSGSLGPGQMSATAWRQAGVRRSDVRGGALVLQSVALVRVTAELACDSSFCLLGHRRRRRRGRRRR